MDTKSRRPHLSAMEPRAELQTHATLLARLQTVQLLKMSEREIAELIRDAENDPIFERLLYPKEREMEGGPIPTQPPDPTFALLFMSSTRKFCPQGLGLKPRLSSPKSGAFWGSIQRMGQENFETHFLRVEKSWTAAGVAAELEHHPRRGSKGSGFPVGLLGSIGIFRSLVKSPGSHGQRVVRLARISLDDAGEPVFEFGSPLLARGRYDIHYEHLQEPAHGTGSFHRKISGI
jgi:hypothetical protein